MTDFQFPGASSHARAMEESFYGECLPPRIEDSVLKQVQVRWSGVERTVGYAWPSNSPRRNRQHIWCVTAYLWACCVLSSAGLDSLYLHLTQPLCALRLLGKRSKWSQRVQLVSSCQLRPPCSPWNMYKWLEVAFYRDALKKRDESWRSV